MDSSDNLQVISELTKRIASRRNASPDTSYTARLLHEGVAKCAKKLGEEAIELALAAVIADRSHIRAEAADVLYHLLVLMEATDTSLNEVLSELDRRMQQSGLDEKASRKRP
ncbi:MAG TPA: phosphoribosyl-ATP diphosphatase [Aestuariivirgaceae bacterium]